ARFPPRSRHPPGPDRASPRRAPVWLSAPAMVSGVYLLVLPRAEEHRADRAESQRALAAKSRPNSAILPVAVPADGARRGRAARGYRRLSSRQAQEFPLASQEASSPR